jgi:hypothetical protein
LNFNALHSGRAFRYGAGGWSGTSSSCLMIVTRGEDIRFLPFPCFLIVSEALRLQLSPYPQYVALSPPHEGDVPVQFQACQFQFGLGRLKK